MTINWNDNVVLRPNDHGWEILARHYLRLGLEPPTRTETWTGQLWNAVRIWGEHVFIGTKLPFVDTNIEVEGVVACRDCLSCADPYCACANCVASMKLHGQPVGTTAAQSSAARVITEKAREE